MQDKDARLIPSKRRHLLYEGSIPWPDARFKSQQPACPGSEGAASYPDTPLSFIPHAWDSSMAPTSLLFIVVNISPRMTRDNSMTLFGSSVGVLPVIHLIHLLC